MKSALQRSSFRTVRVLCDGERALLLLVCTPLQAVFSPPTVAQAAVAASSWV